MEKYILIPGNYTTEKYGLFELSTELEVELIGTEQIPNYKNLLLVRSVAGGVVIKCMESDLIPISAFSIGDTVVIQQKDLVHSFLHYFGYNIFTCYSWWNDLMEFSQHDAVGVIVEIEKHGLYVVHFPDINTKVRVEGQYLTKIMA